MLELLWKMVEGEIKRFREVGLLEWIYCVRLESFWNMLFLEFGYLYVGKEGIFKYLDFVGYIV